MKLLSVAVPCYNSQAYMRNCVDSLLEGGESGGNPYCRRWLKR